MIRGELACWAGQARSSALFSAYFLRKSDGVSAAAYPARWNDFIAGTVLLNAGIRWAAALRITTQSAPPEICPFISPPLHYRRSKTHAQQIKTKRWHDESHGDALWLKCAGGLIDL